MVDWLFFMQPQLHAPNHRPSPLAEGFKAREGQFVMQVQHVKMEKLVEEESELSEIKVV